jgi:hypothetical protein
MSEQYPMPTPEDAVAVLRACGVPDVATLIEAMRRAAEAMRPFVAELQESARRMSEALAPLAEYARQHPDWLEKLERERAEDPGPCRCLCGPVHRGRGVCEGEAAPGLVRVHHGHGVAVCRACYQAGLALVPGAEATGL